MNGTDIDKGKKLISKNLDEQLDAIPDQEEKGKDVIIKLKEKTKQKLQGFIDKIYEETDKEIKLTQADAINLLLTFRTGKTTTNDMTQFMTKFYKVPKVKEVSATQVIKQRVSEKEVKEIKSLMDGNKSLMFAYLTPQQASEWLASIGISFADRNIAHYNDAIMKKFFDFLEMQKQKGDLEDKDYKKSQTHALYYIFYKSLISDNIRYTNPRYINKINEIEGFHSPKK